MSTKRRSITPALGIPAAGLPHTRRVDGPRNETSDRVTLWIRDEEAMGWALNVSRSGLRVIVEDSQVELGATYDISVGGGPRRPGKVVWVQDEPDGQIVGVAFDLGESEHPSAPSAPPASLGFAPGGAPPAGEGVEPEAAHEGGSERGD